MHPTDTYILLYRRNPDGSMPEHAFCWYINKTGDFVYVASCYSAEEWIEQCRIKNKDVMISQ